MVRRAAPEDEALSQHVAASEVWRRLMSYFQLHRERLQGLLLDIGISFGDMRALMVLDPADPRPMRSLADSWACDASNATWMVDRLEQRGFVERRAWPTDRRVKAVVLTPLGVEIKQDLIERLHEPPPEILALDPVELDALLSLLARLHPAGDQPPA